MDGGHEIVQRLMHSVLHTLLAAELVMSTHVSAALCQKTPTVLLQLGRRRGEGGEGGEGEGREGCGFTRSERAVLTYLCASMNGMEP